MDKKHLPYNVLLVIAVAAIGLMAICTFGLRRSSFAVTVGYAVPRPEIVPVAEAAAPQPVKQPEPGVLPAGAPPEEEPLPEAAPAAYYGEPEDKAVGVRFPLDLNEAAYDELILIPGVGNVMAQRITQYRDHLGGAYASMSQLMDIKGIGASTYRKITAYLYLDGEESREAEESGEEPEETYDDEDRTDWEEAE